MAILPCTASGQWDTGQWDKPKFWAQIVVKSLKLFFIFSVEYLNVPSRAMFRSTVLEQSNLFWDRKQSFIHWSHHQMLQNSLFFLLSASGMPFSPHGMYYLLGRILFQLRIEEKDGRWLWSVTSHLPLSEGAVQTKAVRTQTIGVVLANINSN